MCSTVDTQVKISLQNHSIYLGRSMLGLVLIDLKSKTFLSCGMHELRTKLESFGCLVDDISAKPYTIQA